MSADNPQPPPRGGRVERGLAVAVNVAVLAFLAMAAFAPAGPVRSFWNDVRERRHLQREIEELWPRMAGEDMSGPPILVEFTDYQCPFCRRAHDTVSAAEAAGEFRVIYRHLPLTDLHARAEDAARASICAEEQGRFTEMHQSLFESSAWEEQPPPLLTLAIRVGVPDTARFRACFHSPTTIGRIESDREIARRLGISGTPAFVTPNGLKRGLATRQELIDLVGL